MNTLVRVGSSIVFVCIQVALAAGALAQNAAEPSGADLLDRIVAVVNDDVITRIELDAESRMAVEQLRRQGTPLPKLDVLERQLLERMITKRALLQHARQTGMRVSDVEVERAIERIAQDNKLTPTTLRETVERDGITYDKFREDVRGEIVLARLREREVESRVAVTDAEIANFLRNQGTQGDKTDEYRLSHVLVTVPEQAGPDEIKARRGRAEAALSQLKQGSDFRQVAASYSDAADALNGGDMGWRGSGRLPAVFVEAVKTMKVGQTSDVVRSANGFHILKLVDKRGSETPIMVTQTHTRHILIRLNEIVSENDARNRLTTLKDRIDSGADFAELARLHSDDPSAARGGDLGWVSPGDTVPEFERAMEALKLNQTSVPVKTPFGWHIIQVLERRDQDVSKEKGRNLARQSLRSRKSEDQWDEWIRQQRDKAYVEYHLEEK